MIFKTMDPEEAKRALEGQQNVLTSEVEKEKEYFKHLRCPSCGGECFPIIDTSRIFKDGAILPNNLARCRSCGADFEPYTGIQVSVSRPSRVG